MSSSPLTNLLYSEQMQVRPFPVTLNPQSPTVPNKVGGIPMSDKTDAILAIIAALLVLFTAMLDPRVSAGLAIALFIAFAVIKLFGSRDRTK